MNDFERYLHASDLAEIADTVAEAHAARAQSVRPNLGDVGADDRVGGVAKKALGHAVRVRPELVAAVRLFRTGWMRDGVLLSVG